MIREFAVTVYLAESFRKLGKMSTGLWNAFNLVSGTS